MEMHPKACQLPHHYFPLPRMARGVKFEGAIMGRRSPKREDHWVESARGVIGPNYSSDQAQPSQDNLVREIKESGSPKEPKGQMLLKRPGTNHQGHKVEG